MSIAPTATTNQVISQKHFQEWLEAGVDPGLVELNVKSLSGDEVFEYLFHGLPLEERRNDGRVRDKWLKRYEKITDGGFWVNGVALETGEESLWGQFKPDEPRKYFDGKGGIKEIKYEAPPKMATEAIALGVTFYQSWKVVRRKDDNCKRHWIERFRRHASQVLPSHSLEHEGGSRKGGSSLQGIKRLYEACEKGEYSEIDRIFSEAERFLRSDSFEHSDLNYRRVRDIIRGRDTEFWAWVIKTPKIPVTVTEGAKKAAALLSQGMAAIALPGIYNGYRQERDSYGKAVGLPYLIPQLEAIAHKNREIVFAFDNDKKPKTRKNVRIAIGKTGRLFGSKGCRVSVMKWDSYSHKGIDDLIVAEGKEVFSDVWKRRISLDKYNSETFEDLAEYAPIVINQRYIENITPPPKAKVIGIKSPKGTGKTEYFANLFAADRDRGIPTLVISHRIQLAKELSDRLGIDFIDDIYTSPTKGALGYGLCIDSLHPNSKANFDPENWQGANVFFDEAEQVIWHMLNSATCQENRVEIIQTFVGLIREVIGTRGKIYLADADLTTVSLDYVTKVIGAKVETWVVENQYERDVKRELHSYSGNDPGNLLSALTDHIKQGGNPFVHTTGQKAKSKWGTINLESYLKKQMPYLKVLRIDRESVADPEHPAYGCIHNLNEILKSYDVAIASPVIETGVSIDLKEHFDSVWGIAQGVQTVESVCQALERVRDDVPRHVWAKKTAKGNAIANGAITPKALLSGQNKLAKAHMGVLCEAGFWGDLYDCEFSQDSLCAWAQRACIVNLGKRDYRRNIIDKMLSEGYKLYEPKDPDKDVVKGIKEQLNEVRDVNYKKHVEEVAKAPIPSAEKLEELKNKKVKTEREKNQEKKGTLRQLYGQKITQPLIKKHDEGWYPQLQLHFFLTVGNQFLTLRDSKSVGRLAEGGKGKLFKPDFNQKCLAVKVNALKMINIEQFLDPEATFTKHTLQEWFEQMVQIRFQLKEILGIGINPEKDTAIPVAQRLLRKLGLKLERVCQKRENGKHVRIYRGCTLNPDGRDKIFDYWCQSWETNGVTPDSIEDLSSSFPAA